MIWLILVIIALLAIIVFIIKFKSDSKQEQSLKVDKGVLEARIQDLTLERGILIKHAKSTHEDTITSKKQLAEVKREIIKKYDHNNINSVMDYINGPE